MNFDLVSQAYDLGRPLYPATVFEETFQLVDASPVTLEIGSGSGQATVTLAAQSKRLDCVEPGQKFVAHLERKFADLGHVAIVNQDFEDFGGAGPYDLVFSGSALHWVPKHVALAKIQQLLKPGGWLVTVWNQLAIAPQIDQIIETQVRSQFADFQLPVFEPQVHQARFSDGLTELCESWDFRSCEMNIMKLPRAVSIATFVAMLESYADVAGRSAEEVEEIFSKTASALSIAKHESIEIVDYFPMAMAQRS